MLPAGGAGQGREPEKRRRVEFQDVTIYRFARRQGYVCVPSQGGNTLGMEDQHYGVEVVTVDEHAADRRRESREAELERHLQLGHGVPVLVVWAEGGWQVSHSCHV